MQARAVLFARYLLTLFFRRACDLIENGSADGSAGALAAVFYTFSWFSVMSPRALVFYFLSLFHLFASVFFGVVRYSLMVFFAFFKFVVRLFCCSFVGLFVFRLFLFFCFSLFIRLTRFLCFSSSRFGFLFCFVLCPFFVFFFLSFFSLLFSFCCVCFVFYICRNNTSELMADLIIFVCWFLSIVTIINAAPRVRKTKRCPIGQIICR